MIWHVVRFDFGAVEETERRALEADLAALASIDEVAWLRVGRDIEDPAITGLITGFADREALDTYRVHPEHVPVVERIRALGIPAVRLDLHTDDDPEQLP